MTETHTLASEITFPTPPSLTSYDVVRFSLDRGNSEHSVLCVVRSNTGRLIEARYIGETATTLMTALNTANRSVKSLQKRVLERLAQDGFLPTGTVTGTPD